MVSKVVEFFTIFLLCFFFSSGTIVAETLPMKSTQKNKIGNQENRRLFSSSVTTRQLDVVPILNPTTTPTVNPTEEPPPAPAAVTTTPTTTSPTTTTPTSSGGKWCVASPTASQTALQVALDYACGYGGADCSKIQPGGSCYDPNTVRDHASYAFSDYYQKNPIPTSCIFGGTAQLTTTDPSSGNCQYASPKTTPSISSPVNPIPITTTPAIMTPPATMTPTLTTPSGPTVYGVAEPTGLPSSATSISRSFLRLIPATGIMSLLLAAILI